MKREEEIEDASTKYTDKFGRFICDMDDSIYGFIDGARWADKHPSYSLIAKIWNLATKTAIAQFNGEMSFFKSENEIKEYIKKHIRL